MLDKDPSTITRLVQTASLVLSPLFFLPFSTSLLIVSYAIHILVPQNSLRRLIRRSPRFHPRTVLITGVGTAKGLRIARAFYETGHKVVGADFESLGVPVNGRFSRALSVFRRLRMPTVEYGAVGYIQDILNIVEKENVDLWISCSDLVSVVEDGQAKELLERRTSCKSFQFDVQSLEPFHRKEDFYRFTRSIGLPAPEIHQVRSRSDVHSVLNEANGTKKYIIKAPGANGVSGNQVLPRRTLSQTYQHVSRFKISKEEPWILQQYVTGEEYCTHAVVIEGEVKLFVACPSPKPLGHYQALPQESGISKAMLNFTQIFAEKVETAFTGHLSFEFSIEEKVTDRGIQRNILPIACSPRPHTATVLFSGLRGSTDMVRAYLSAIVPSTNGINDFSGLHHPDYTSGEIAVPEPTVPGVYWSGQDFVSLVLLPLLSLLTFKIGLLRFVNGCVTFVNHMVFWRDAIYELWDPMPWWWLYHVYLPVQLLASTWMRHKWTVVDVSTTKMLGS